MIKYVSYMLDSLSSDFKEAEQLRYFIDKAMLKDIGNINRDNYVLEVSPMLYKIMQKNLVRDVYLERYMGILVSINENLVSNQIRIKYERNDSMSVPFSGFGGIYFNENKLPDKVLINKKKKATTLLFDDEAIVVKKNKNDKEDYEKAFLWGYFIKKSGLSKTQASKYIKKIMEENII